MVNLKNISSYKKLIVIAPAVLVLVVAIYWILNSNIFADVASYQVVANSSATYTIGNQSFTSKSNDLKITIKSAPAPSPTPSIIPGGNRTFYYGFSLFGGISDLSSSLFTQNSLAFYKFDGPSNKWVIAPESPAFNTTSNESYYVLNQNSTPRSFVVPGVSSAPEINSIKPGWNLLYNKSAKTLSTLKFNLFSSENRCLSKEVPYRELADAKVIKSKIFIISNQNSKKACEYFKILNEFNSVANCGNDEPGSISLLPADSSYWVYLYPEKVNLDFRAFLPGKACN